jgi:hypothetical protein
MPSAKAISTWPISTQLRPVLMCLKPQHFNMATQRRPVLMRLKPQHFQC